MSISMGHDARRTNKVKAWCFEQRKLAGDKKDMLPHSVGRGPCAHSIEIKKQNEYGVDVDDGSNLAGD